MTGIGFVLRMAWREAKAAPGRLLLLGGAVTLGVAALVAIDSFAANLRASVGGQARDLLGADLAFTSRRPFGVTAERLLTEAARGGALARTTGFAGMAYVPRTTGTRLVQVTAVEGGWPFYGAIVTEPASAWRELRGGGRVIIDPALASALAARVGDTLSLGEAKLVISGTVTTAPGDAGFRNAFGPRIFIAAKDLAATQLVGFGARVEYNALVRLADGTDAEGMAARFRKQLSGERVRVRTVTEEGDNLSEVLTRLTNFLGLVALIAVLLGGLGVASAVSVFVKRQRPTIAVLRCLGASSAQVFGIHVAQAALLGLGGSAAGALLGVLVQLALPKLLRGVLPIDVTITFTPAAVLTGLLVGGWIALVFALLPLLAVRRVPPLQVLRRDYGGAADARDPWRYVVMALIVASVVLVATRQVGTLRAGIFFALGIAAAIGVLALAAWALVRGVRRWFPASWPYVWRQGLANLYRPANQTLAIVLALGFGTFLLGTLLVVQRTLLQQLRTGGGADRPNLVLFDIQRDQKTGIDSTLRARGLPVVGPVPIVPMRIRAVKGMPVRTEQVDTATVRGEADMNRGWAVRREYRSTYRAERGTAEKVVAGAWWDDAPRDTLAAARISIEQGLAKELGVGLGDEIVWDVQGVAVPTRIASLREVNWARFEPNFFVVFEPGPLDAAPQTLVSLTRVPDAAARGTLQRALAERFPNVTTLDLTAVQGQLEALVDRVSLAIRFLALFSLATGALVLVGALATSRWQRIREGALLRTLGATKAQLTRVVLAEYLALGLLSSIVGAGLALLSGWTLATRLFRAPFVVPSAGLVALVVGVVGGTALIGALASREVVRRTPVEVLREE